MRDFDPTAAEFISTGYTERSRPGGFFYDPVSIFSAVAPSVIGALTADDASGQLQQGAQQAQGITQAQYDQARTDFSPYMKTGSGANNKLARLLGIGGAVPDVEAFIRDSAGRGYDGGYRYGDADRAGVQEGAIGNYRAGQYGDADAALKLFGYDPSQDAGADEYGSLLKKYTGADLASDPGYQFRVSEGQKGVERSAAGRGGLFSGQAGKELERFRQSLASTEFGNAFNRDASSKNQIYSMLSGQSAQGLGATGNLANLGAQTASQNANYATQGANAGAAGTVGVGNAITGGLNNYQNYNMLNSLFNKTQTGGADSSYIPMQPGGGY